MKISCFARLRTQDRKSDILEIGIRRRNLWLNGSTLTVRRLGLSGHTTGATQARYYVCDETNRVVLAGPFCRLRHADTCLQHMFRLMSTDIPLMRPPDISL